MRPEEANDRSSKEVIDDAIRENTKAEWIMYVISLVIVAAGVFLLIKGAIDKSPLEATSGAVASALFIPAMRYTRQIRKENIAIRLMEAPLSRVDTAQEASQMLSLIAKDIMIEK